MKTLSLLLIAFSAGLVLFESNPKAKRPYLKHVARDVQSRCCSATSAPISSTDCRRLRPFTQSAAEIFLHLYTDAPKDHIFFTRYITRLPNQTIYGIGIAGQFISWADRSTDGEPCNIFYDTLFMNPQ